RTRANATVHVDVDPWRSVTRQGPDTPHESAWSQRRSPFRLESLDARSGRSTEQTTLMTFSRTFRHRRQFLSVCAIMTGMASVGSFAARANAQSPSSSSDARVAAEGLFDAGRKLMADGRFAEACEKFRKSEELDPAGGTLLNLGGCYERTG